jgi:hypothetical protein
MDFPSYLEPDKWVGQFVLGMVAVMIPFARIRHMYGKEAFKVKPRPSLKKCISTIGHVKGLEYGALAILLSVSLFIGVGICLRIVYYWAKSIDFLGITHIFQMIADSY